MPRTALKRVTSLGLGSVLLSAVIHFHASAQPLDEPNPTTPELDQAPALQTEAESQCIVISANRCEQAQFEADRSMSVVQSERMDELQARSLPEAVAEANGLTLQQTNRGAGAPIIRGLIGPQNLILVDGVRFNTSIFRTGPNQYLNTLDRFAVRQVEVVRGPSSVLYGNGAMGGVLQVLTLEPELGSESLSWNGRALGRFTSADATGEGALQLGAGSARAAVLTGGAFSRFGTLRTGGGGRLPLSDFEAGHWHVKGIYSPGSSWSLVGAYLGTMLRNTGRTDQAGRGDLRFYDNDDHLGYLQFRWVGDGALQELKANLSVHRASEHVNRFTCATNKDGVVTDRDACFRHEDSVVQTKYRYDDAVNVIGANVSSSLELLEHRLRTTGGIDLYQEFVDSTKEKADAAGGFAFAPTARGNFSNGSTYRSLGFFLHGVGTLLNFGDEKGELRLTGGARLSNFAAAAPEVPAVGDVDYSYTGVVAASSLQFLKPGKFNLYISFVQGFRAPDLQESTVLGDTGSKFEIPNPDLQPERSDTVELGSRADFGPVEASAAYFYSFLKDAIDQEPATWEGQTEIDQKPVVRRTNSASGVYQGAEASVGVHVWRFLLSANAAWTQGELTRTDGTSTPARWIPPLFGSTTLRYQHPDQRIFGEIFMQWASRQDRLNPLDEKDLRICETAPFSGKLRSPCNGTDGWVTFNIRGGWRITKWIRAELALHNLSDIRYRIHGSGIDAPGFDARATVTVAF